MSDKDKQLINQAKNTSCYMWYSIESLIEQAESHEVKERLRDIMNCKYHIEEYKNRTDRWDV